MPISEVAAGVDATVAHGIEVVLRPLLTLYTLAYIVRIPLTWYPEVEVTKLPWSIVVAPTEPFLGGIRKAVGQTAGGVDVSPIILVCLISFLNEILLGPQGILILIQEKSNGAF